MLSMLIACMLLMLQWLLRLLPQVMVQADADGRWGWCSVVVNC